MLNLLQKNLLAKIFEHIDKKDLFNVSQTCKSINSIFEKPGKFWVDLIKKDFGVDYNNFALIDKYAKLNSKQFYLELLHEKKKVIAYIGVYILILIQNQMKDENDEFEYTEEKFLDLYNNTLTLNDNVFSAINSNEASKRNNLSSEELEIYKENMNFVNTYIHNYIELTVKDFLDGKLIYDLGKIEENNYYENHRDIILFINDFILIEKKIKHKQSNCKVLYQNYDFNMIFFDAICITNSALLMQVFLEKYDNLINHPKATPHIFLHAFNYPNIEIIDILLAKKININQNGWLRIHPYSEYTNPLSRLFFFAFNSANERKRKVVNEVYLNKYYKVVEKLLSAECDPEMICFMNVDGDDSENNFKACSISFSKMLQYLEDDLNSEESYTNNADEKGFKAAKEKLESLVFNTKEKIQSLEKTSHLSYNK